MSRVPVRSELASLEETLTDPPELAALLLSSHSHSHQRTSPLSAHLIQLSIHCRVNHLIHRFFEYLERVQDSADAKVIEGKFLHLLQLLSNQYKQVSSSHSSVPSAKSISLLQMVPLPAEQTVWPLSLSLSVADSDFLQNPPVTTFLNLLNETFFADGVGSQSQKFMYFGPVLVTSFRVLIESGFAVSPYRVPLIHYPRHPDNTVNTGNRMDQQYQKEHGAPPALRPVSMPLSV